MVSLLLPLLLLLSKVAAELFIDAPHFIEVEEDTAKTIRPAIEITRSIVDEDDADAQLGLSISCTGGFVSLPPSPSFNITPLEEVHALRANGTIDALNEGLAQATYTSSRDNFVVWTQAESNNLNLQVCTVVVEESTSDDGGYRATDKITFFVDVLPVNDPPTIIVPGVVHRILRDRGGYAVEWIDTLTVEEDEPLSIDMFISDVDIHPYDPTDISFFTVDLKASHGSSITLRGTAGLYFSRGASSTDAMRFRGTLSSINNALRGLRFVGPKDYYGNVTLTAQVWDEGNVGRGGELSEKVVLPISVLSVDDAPMIVIPSSHVVCGEETLCTIAGVEVKDQDATRDSFVIIKANVELGRIDVMRTGIPSSISVEKADKHSLVVRGSFAEVNKMLASLSYHGTAGTHFRVDTIKLHFFEANASNGGNEGTIGMPMASAKIKLLLTDTKNNGPSIEYSGAMYRNDASCSATATAGHSPENASVPSANLTSPPIIDEGMCNRLVRTEAFVCTEDQMCQLSGISVVDVDSEVLQVQMAVSHGALDIPEDSWAGLTMNSGHFSTSSYTFVLKGIQEYINNALSALSYKARRHYHGMDSLVITVTDGDGDSSQMDSMVIPINIVSVKDLPKIAGPDDVLSVEEDGFVAVAVKLMDVDGSALGPIGLEISAKYGAIGFDDSQEGMLHVDAKGTVAERDTATTHRWYSSVVIRGEVKDLNLVTKSLVFGPEINFNTETSGYASVSMVLFCDSYRIDYVEYLIRVESVDDAPLVAIAPSVTTGVNDTVVSILEDTYLNLEAKVSDVDDKKLSVVIASKNGSMRVFKRTRTCFSCDDLDDILIDTAEDGRTIKMEGTIDSLNSKLGDIRFMPDEDFSGESSVHISVADDHGAKDSAEQLIKVIPVSDSFELWMPTSVSSGFVPELEIVEGEKVLIGATWYHPRFMLALYSLSQDNVDGRSRLISPPFRHEYLETPQAFALVDKEEAASSFCAEMQVDIGSISLDNDNFSATLEAKTSSDNKALKFIGNVDDLNMAARHTVFSADTEESGYTSLNITICEGSCGWSNVRPPSRGCVEGTVNIHVEPLNNPPTITISDEQDQSTKILLNSKEVPIASIVIDDPDLTDGMIVDPHQRNSAGLLTVVLRASAGMVSLKTLDGLSFLRGTGVSNQSVVFMGQLKDVNHALSTLYFTCFEGIYDCAEGKASVEITVDDNGYFGKGGPLSADAVIDLVIVAAAAAAEGM